MPNHVTTRLIIEGAPETIDRLIESYIMADPEDGKPCLNFQQVIPRPASLDITSGTRTDMGIQYWLIKGGARSSLDPLMLLGRRVREQEYLERIESDFPDAIDLGRQALRNIIEHGAVTWYEWSVRHWGTKWNSYEFTQVMRDPGRYECTFETAWSFPEPILARMAESFPALSFSAVCFDEGWNFAGVGKWRAGGGSFERAEATAELYEQVYGEPYAEPEEE